jgi:hypothetical protein
VGRIEFNHPGAAKRSVEIDLSQSMFGDLFGIGDALLAGVSEALRNSPEAQDGSQAIQMAAEKAAAAREFVSIAKDVIHSVRVRAYEQMENLAQERSGILAHYDQQLQAGGWENAVRAQDGDKTAQISIACADGAIKGLFIVASEGDNLVLVNVHCDISPENAKRLSTAAVKAGLQAGLGKELEKAMRHVK